MEQELWTLTLKGDDIKAYNNRFHELALMCPDLVPNEKKKVERYIRGFPKRIKENTTSSKPATLHEAINMARKLVEQAVQALAEGRGYAGNLPWYNRCKAHHQPGLCPPRRSNYHKLGHEEEDCRTRIPVARGNSLQNVTCFSCGEKGHYRDKCLRGRNPQNEGAHGGAYVIRTKEPQQDPNLIVGLTEEEKLLTLSPFRVVALNLA
ncbi:reverse transcriptase domain-containing protein [Tanacetum coccineum]